MGCMESKDPEAVAAVYQMFGHHLQLTMKHLGMTISINEAENSVLLAQASTAFSDSRHACPILPSFMPAPAGDPAKD